MANKTSQPQSNTPELIFVGHSDTVTKLVFSPDGKWLVSAANDGRIIVWDVNTGEMAHVIPGHRYHDPLIAFSSNSQFCATSRHSGLTIWNAQTWQPLWSKSITLDAFDFVPHTSLLAINRRSIVEFWDVTTESCLRKIRIGNHFPYIRAMAISPDGSFLATVTPTSKSDILNLWDITSGKLVLTHKVSPFDDPYPTHMKAITFSPDSNQVAGVGDYVLCLWDLVSDSLKCPEINNGCLFHINLCYSPDGTRIATAADAQSIALYDSHTGQLTQTLIVDESRSMSIAYSPNGLNLAIGRDDSTIELWDTQTTTQVTGFPGSKQEINDLAIDQTGRQLAYGGKNGKIGIWDLDTVTHIGTLAGHDKAILNIAFSTDGNTLASSAGEYRSYRTGELCLWDSKTLELLQKRKTKRQLCSVSFSPTSNTIATGTRNPLGTIRLWNSTALTPKGAWKVGTSPSVSAVFSPDGTKLATTEAHSFKIWDTATKERLFALDLESNDGYMESVKFSPDGSQFVLTTYAGGHGLYIYNLLAGCERYQIAIPGEGLLGLSISSDSTTIAVGSYYDRAIWIVDNATNEIQQTIDKNCGSVRALEFLPFTHTLASLSTDGTIKFWNGVNGKLLLTLICFDTENPNDEEWIAFTPEGYYNASANIAKHIRWRVGTEVLPGDTYAETCYRPDIVAESLKIKNKEKL